jgi:hypothetical protein
MWSWTKVGAIEVSQSGYTFKWTVPLGSSTLNTEELLFQTEGCSDTNNISWYCPADIDAQGRYCGTTESLVSFRFWEWDVVKFHGNIL